MSPNSDNLRKEFDRRLGRRSSIGRAANQPKSKKSQDVEKPEHIRQNTGRAIRQRISTGAQNLPSDTKKAYRRQFGGGATQGFESGASTFQRNMNKIVDDTVKELQTRIATEQAIGQAMESPSAPVEDVERGIFDAIKDLATKKGPLGFLADSDGGENFGSDPGDANQAPFWQGLMEDFSRSPAGRAMDIVSRPAYGVFEGMQTALEAGYGTDGSHPDDLLHSFDDFFSGFNAGFSGRDKTGFGDVWQTMKDNSQIAGMENIRAIEEDYPDAAKWIDRGIGLGGELAFDPTNYVSGGAAGVVASTGEQLTEASAKTAIRNTVDTATRDFYDDIVTTMGGGRHRPSQDAMAARAVQAAEDSIERNLLDISAGANAGWSKMGTESSAQATANRVAEEVRVAVSGGFDRRVDAALTALEQGGNIPIRAWRTHIAQSPEFENMVDEMMNEAEKNFINRGKVVPWNNRDQYIMQLGAGDTARIRRWANKIRSDLDAPLQQYIVDTVYSATRDLSYNTIGIKVRGKTYPIKTIGKVYAAAKGKLPQSLASTAEDAAAAISFERNFPGRISLMTQHNKSLGLQAFERFRDDWRKIARDFTQEESKTIMRALQDPSMPLPPKLENMRRRIRDEYNKIFADEIAHGARPEGSPMADEYAFIFNKGGKKETRTDFKKGRKEEVRSTAKASRNNTGTTGRFKLDKAKDDGLRPVEDAFEALLLRKLKQTRDISRAMFMKDLVENYGVFAKPLSDFAVEQRGLKALNTNNLPQYMRDLAKKERGNYYLPNEHMKMFETYLDQSGWNPSDKGRVQRNFNKITNIIKYLSTVPRAGFHIRNMIGDFYMGILDNVPGRTYPEVFDKYLLHKAGKTPKFAIAPGIVKTWDEMAGLYQRYANSGFFDTDIPLGGDVKSAGQRINNARKRVADMARTGSDMREDFGRFAHFVAAYRQEYNALLKKGIKDPVRLAEKTVDAAVWRVNRYKFDYGALTTTERKMKMVFPFYTFARKATPVLAAQLFLNPHYMSLVNRFMEYNDGSSADNFNHYYLPDYLKDMGYAMLDDSEEPMALSQGLLPTSVLNTLDFTNSQQFAQSIGSMGNPLLQAIPELATDTQLFSGRGAGSAPEYLSAKNPLAGIIEQIAQVVQGERPGNPNEPSWMHALSDTWTGAGIPVSKITQEQQDWGFRNMEDRFIQDPFSEFNRSQEQIRVYQSNRKDGTSFRVENVATGEILWEGPNPSQALQTAKRLING